MHGNTGLDLTKAWRITLTKPKKRKRNKLVQYIEADTLDNAVLKARKSFLSRLYGFDTVKGSAAQRACKNTVLHGRLCFGFGHGHYTMSVEGMTIFQAMERARGIAFIDGNIEEITTSTFGEW